MLSSRRSGVHAKGAMTLGDRRPTLFVEEARVMAAILPKPDLQPRQVDCRHADSFAHFGEPFRQSFITNHVVDAQLVADDVEAVIGLQLRSNETGKGLLHLTELVERHAEMMNKALLWHFVPSLVP